jgi:acyl-CoA reductase-like NAD-dependent aldehyde dehydrogenase
MRPASDIIIANVSTELFIVVMVGLNRGLVSDPAVPFGGTKHSGLGREGTHESIKEFLETQYVSAAW